MQQMFQNSQTKIGTSIRLVLFSSKLELNNFLSYGLLAARKHKSKSLYNRLFFTFVLINQPFKIILWAFIARIWQ